MKTPTFKFLNSTSEMLAWDNEEISTRKLEQKSMVHHRKYPLFDL